MANPTNLDCVITQLHGKGGRAIRVDNLEQVYMSRSLCQLLIALDYQERDRVGLDILPNANTENKYVPWVAMHIARKQNVVALEMPEPAPTAIADQICGILQDNARQQEMAIEQELEPKWGHCSRDMVADALKQLGGFASTRELADAVGLEATANCRSTLEKMWKTHDVLKISVNTYGKKTAGRTYWARDYETIDYVLGDE
jgi:hypothetical protein